MAAAMVGAYVCYDALRLKNPLGTSVFLGVLFGIFWPFTLVLWSAEKTSDNDKGNQ